MAQTPKAFVSYSWSSPGHCDRIRSYAERLVNDGVDIVLDQWDLSEGQDKYAFMEQMVTDPSVSHVIIFSDATYAHKADKRQAGVGTESQIISKKIYEKVDQKKFIPVVCEKRDDEEPCLPVFLQSRIWIDFSNTEKTHENWERLLRALYGKPVYEKPTLGKTPSYLLSEEGRPALPTIGKYNSLRNALLESKPTVSLYRNDFLEAAIAYADNLRVRERPDIDKLEEKVLADAHALLPLRDQLVDWLLLDTSLTEQHKFLPVLLEFMERLLALKYRPPEMTHWNDAWFDAHGIFVYEMFIYVVAVLVKVDWPNVIRELLSTHYFLPDSEAHRGRDFVTFGKFSTHSRVLDERNKRLDLRRIDPLADLLKERATRDDLPFRDIIQAEMILFLVSVLSDSRPWYPRTSVFASDGRDRLPLFVRATQHKHFERLKIIAAVESADDLRNRFKEGYERHHVGNWHELIFWGDVEFWNLMNMDALDSME